MELLRRESNASITSEKVKICRDQESLNQSLLMPMEVAKIRPDRELRLSFVREDGELRSTTRERIPHVAIVADDPEQEFDENRLVTVKFLSNNHTLDNRLVQIKRKELLPGQLFTKDTGRQVVSPRPDWGPFEASFTEVDHLQSPFFLGKSRGRNYWIFKHTVYSSIAELKPEEVVALLMEEENKTKAKVARALVLAQQVEMIEQSRKRQPIPDDVKIFVWQRDQGRCVKCQNNQALEFDHVIPVSMGGSNTARNLQLLCESCNRSKGGSLV